MPMTQILIKRKTQHLCHEYLLFPSDMYLWHTLRLKAMV